MYDREMEMENGEMETPFPGLSAIELDSSVKGSP